MLKSWTYKEQGLDAKVELFHDHILWTTPLEQQDLSFEKALERPEPIGPLWIDAELLDYLQVLLARDTLPPAADLIFAFYKGLQSHRLADQTYFWPKEGDTQLQLQFSKQGLVLLEEGPYQIKVLAAQRLWHFYLQGINMPGLPLNERRKWRGQIQHQLRWPQLAPPFVLLDYDRLPLKRYEAQDENGELYFLALNQDHALLGQGKGQDCREEKRSYERLIREGAKGLPHCLAAYWPMLLNLLETMRLEGQFPSREEDKPYEGPAPGQAPPA